MLARFEVDLPEPFDERRLVQALLAVSVRYFLMRAQYRFVNGQWHQIIRRSLRAADFPIQILHEGEDAGRIGADIRVQDAPLIRVGIVRRNQQPDLLVLAVHQVIAGELDFDAHVIPDLLSSYRYPEAPFWRPPDFPKARLSAEQAAGLPLDVEDVYPLSAIQSGMMFHTIVSHESDIYCFDSPIAFCDPEFSLGAFRQALQSLVDQHEILRTRLWTQGVETPYQVIFRTVPIKLDYQDFGDTSIEECHVRIREDLARTRQRGYRFQFDDLYRVKVYRLQGGICQVVIMHHHLLLDGWSQTNLCAEILARYESCKSGMVPRTEPLACSYRDMIDQEQECIANPETAQFWRELLKDHNATPLPAGLPGTEYADRHVSWLTETTMSQLQRQARVLHVPLRAVLLAAYVYFIHIASGEDIITVGAVSHTRPALPDGDRVLGCFLNTLPVKIHVGSCSTWADLVQAVNGFLVAMKPHEGMPLAEITKLTALPTGQDIFDITFNFLDFSAANAAARSFPIVDSVVAGAGRINTGFNVTFYRQNDDCKVVIEALSGRYTQISLELLAGYLCEAVRSVASDLSASLREPLVLTAEQQRELLFDFNATNMDYDKAQCIHHLFEAQVKRRPEAVALVCGNRQLTFGELNAVANGLAHYLRGEKVGPDTPVGLCMHRSLEMVIGMLGILKAGGAYVPIDPQHPGRRIADILEDSGAALLLTEKSLEHLYEGFRGQIVTLDSCLERFAPCQMPNLANINDSDNLAYVMYTSGSTGRPKGVMVSHRNVVNLLKGLAQRQGFLPGETLVSVTSISFDISVLEVFGSLGSGVRLVIADERTQHDSQMLEGLLAAEGATLFQTTPSGMQLLLDSEGGVTALRGLKSLLVGGEPLPQPLAQTLAALPGNVYNMYGPTETTIWSTMWQVVPDCQPLIGRPLANTRVYVLDRHLRLCPVGVPGEICIAGDGVSRGYRNREEQSRQAFPWITLGGASTRIYRTGDLGRYMPDGQLECLGRIDHQVKIRGHRIELGEVEAACHELSFVQECAVVVHACGSDKRLVAYWTSRSPDPVKPSEFRDALRKKLPEYMVPSHFILLKAFPLTPNGKVNRSALPVPATTPETTVEAPRNPVEKQLVEIWSEILGVKTVSITDSFLDIGGHSLSAIRMVSQIRARMNVTLPLRVVFEVPILSQLAEAITASFPQQPLAAGDEADVLQAMSALSDEEIAKLLAEVEEDHD